LSSDKIIVPAPEFDDIDIDVSPVPNPDTDNDNPTWNPEEILDGVKLVPPPD
jgi:hypothetical protein